MEPGEQTTGTRDEHYSLISVLYHALHGAENCAMYAVDAEAAGDERLGAFFREAQGVQAGLAEQAKGLLGIPEGAPEPGRYSATAASPETEVPPEGMVAPEAPQDVRRGTEPESPPRTGHVTRESPLPGEDQPPLGKERPPETHREPPPPGPPPDANPPA